ncbi:hypothetical protein [Gordonia sihwensis]|uniref:hypothetical protein n=1 Tax=Gordonia sihwensis TaxID=173559 RepID=UPI002416B2AD|nr:hypothetical protein [Gordonia sihwensis]WFN94140.1 hypothetical protein P5P27_06235 [Gordonia sihwensis]WFN94201.1 hypothetical protein P5P27_06545 [Gordonia sihwensis]
MGYRTPPWRPGRELVGPVVYFRNQYAVPVDRTPPRDTVDGDRWAQCTDHHLACDCREAELGEQLRELRSELDLIKHRLTAATEGHPTFVEERYGSQRRRDLECQCTGCSVTRALAHTAAVRLYDNTIQI